MDFPVIKKARSADPSVEEQAAFSWASARAELARRKLPPLYVERFVSELSDHLTDWREDRMSTDAKDLHGVFERLGSPGQVAASAAQEYRRARFSRRHPVLMFVVLPLVALSGWTGIR